MAEIELAYASAVGSLGERIPLADVRNHFVMYRSLRNAAEKLYGAAYPASSPFATEVSHDITHNYKPHQPSMAALR